MEKISKEQIAIIKILTDNFFIDILDAVAIADRIQKAMDKMDKPKGEMSDG